MGCLLACLRFRDGGEDKRKKKALLKSSPVPSKSKEPLLPDEQFVGVFISEDLSSGDYVDEDVLDRELREEVTFLKSCGAILETPPEFRKSSDPSLSIPGTIKKLVWDEEEDSNFRLNSSAASAGFSYEQHQAERHKDSAVSSGTLRETVYLEPGSGSTVLDVASSDCDTQILPHCIMGSVCSKSGQPDLEVQSVAEPAPLDVSLIKVDTPIRVLNSEGICMGSTKDDPDIEPEVATIKSDASPFQDGFQTQPLGYNKHSPYPTPLKLTDEMETPCTIYPSNPQNIIRKNVRVRSQYVYPVLNPVENRPSFTEEREGLKLFGQPEVNHTLVASSPNNSKDKRSINREELDKENYASVKRMRSLTPLSESRFKVTPNSENEKLLGSSLSQCLKPSPGDDKKSLGEISAAKLSCPIRTPDVDRPILGVVAMHWNEEDTSKVSPRCWGGNGIPNTTTKYKEDQKVSWHTTPFEVRLNKALTDDKFCPQRKDISRNLDGLNELDN